MNLDLNRHYAYTQLTMADEYLYALLRTLEESDELYALLAPIAYHVQVARQLIKAEDSATLYRITSAALAEFESNRAKPAPEPSVPFEARLGPNDVHSIPDRGYLRPGR